MVFSTENIETLHDRLQNGYIDSLDGSYPLDVLVSFLI